MIDQSYKRMKWGLGSLLALALVLVGGASAYAVSYADKALPGVTVAGQSVAGMTRQDVEASLGARVSAAQVTVAVDGIQTTTPLVETGVGVDVSQTLDEVFSQNVSVHSRFSALVASREVAPVVTTDEEVFKAFTKKLAATVGSTPENASVALGEDGSSFVVTPAADGAEVPADVVRAALIERVSALDSGSVEISTVQASPKVTTADAQRVADTANALIALDVVINDGLDDYSASAADKAAWISIPTGADGTLGTPKIDQAKVSEWVKATAEKTNVQPVNGVRNVNSQGEPLTVAREGVPGWTTNNADAVSNEVTAALNAGNPYSGTFHYDEAEPGYDSRQVAEGAENLVYQAAEGEKWIDLDLSESTVIAYQGGKVVGGPFYMVPGAPQTPTVTGTFHVYLQLTSQTMRGENVDGSEYVTPDVPWVTYWYAGFAFHGAPWRSSFGWSGPGGSHGCVNMPVSDAKWLYDWAEIGTTVVSHY